MSYDVYLKKPACETCGHADTAFVKYDGPTYNMTELFHMALTNEPLPAKEVNNFSEVVLGTKVPTRGLRVLSGRKAKDTLKQLRAATAFLREPSRQAELEEVAQRTCNGWGGVDSALECLECYEECAEAYPEYVWEIH